MAKSPARSAACAAAYSALAWAINCATVEVVGVVPGGVVVGVVVPDGVVVGVVVLPEPGWVPGGAVPPKIAVSASPRVGAMTTFCCWPVGRLGVAEGDR